MYPSVHSKWHLFSEPFEGRILHMYLDIKGLVTCGVGNLIDSVYEAQKLPWKNQRTQDLATPGEIADAWRRLKAAQGLSRKGTAHALALTGLVLTDADVDALVERKLQENDAYITEKWFSNFQSIPADAQLAIHSMAWAVGPGFNIKFPNWTRAALAGKWWECAEFGKIRDEDNPGVRPRNAANKLCFQNAANVAANRTDPTVLHWPNKFHPQLATPEDPPPLAPPSVLHGIAAEAAASSLADNLNDLRRDAHRQMAIEPDAQESEPLLDPADEDTAVDGKGNV